MIGPVLLALRAVTALLLFGFLGLAIFTIWKEVRQTGRALAGRRIPGIQLLIDEGGEKPASRFFAAPHLIIGRDPGSDIPLQDDTVSTRHAQLQFHHNQWWVSDLSSTNGTRLNGLPVEIPTVLASGDVIQCGRATLQIRFSNEIIIDTTRKLEG